MASRTDMTWIILRNPVSFHVFIIGHGKTTDRNICFQSGEWQICLSELMVPWYHFLGESRGHI